MDLIHPNLSISTQIRPNPTAGKLDVKTDRPPGNPYHKTHIRDVVNTVGPVPVTFWREPNTFSYSVAHVLNDPTKSEGVQLINEMYVFAARHVELYMTKM